MEHHRWRRLDQQIHFLLELDKLKNVLRQTYLIAAERRENSAEHSWHLAVAAMILADYANAPVDQLRVLKLLLIHDIIEIDAGDTYCFDDSNAVTKEQRERQAADRLFQLLPTDQAQEIHRLWDEFAAGQTPESQFAIALDRLLPLLHNLYTEGQVWKAKHITSDRELARSAPIRDGSEALWDLACAVIAEAVARGYLEPSPAANAEQEANLKC